MGTGIRPSSAREARPRADGPPKRFEIDIEASRLDDLTARLERATLAPPLDSAPLGRLGLEHDRMSSLLDRWRTGYDWRALERAMNQLEHWRVPIDGVPVHYVHARSPEPDALPIVLTHGWPWSFWDFRSIIGPLTDPVAHGGEPSDAFDVVVPSLPGYGFSTPVERSGVGPFETADMWVTLMTDVLGYDRFAAHGSDWGALVTTQLGHKHADRLVGVHVTHASHPGVFNLDRPWAELFAKPYEGASAERRGELAAWERGHVAHLAVHTTEPQTLSYAMHDSPVGLCAWLAERRLHWSDPRTDVEHTQTDDELLTCASVYWLTGSFASSVRYYAEATRRRWVPSHDRSPVVQAPAGISIFRGDGAPTSSFAWLDDVYDVRQFRQHEHGGHFAAVEMPSTVVADLRDHFRPLRG
jgi:pimeloyl-ACP methyl ester carboxylesterase